MNEFKINPDAATPTVNLTDEQMEALLAAKPVDGPITISTDDYDDEAETEATVH